MYKKLNESTFLRLTDNAVIPDDPMNRDRQELQEWLDAGNELEEAKQPPTCNWQGLAIAFKLSQLNQILAQLKDEGTNPEINAIWRISDELVQVLTVPVFSESDRIAGMTQDIQALYEKLDAGNVEVPDSAKTEILQALKENGFTSVAETLSRNSVV